MDRSQSAMADVQFLDITGLDEEEIRHLNKVLDTKLEDSRMNGSEAMPEYQQSEHMAPVTGPTMGPGPNMTYDLSQMPPMAPPPQQYMPSYPVMYNGAMYMMPYPMHPMGGYYGPPQGNYLQMPPPPPSMYHAPPQMAAMANGVPDTMPQFGDIGVNLHMPPPQLPPQHMNGLPDTMPQFGDINVNMHMPPPQFPPQHVPQAPQMSVAPEPTKKVTEYVPKPRRNKKVRPPGYYERMETGPQRNAQQNGHAEPPQQNGEQEARRAYMPPPPPVEEVRRSYLPPPPPQEEVQMYSSMPERPDEAKVRTAPAQSVPAQSAPTQYTLAQSAPVQSAPIQSAPVQSAPIQSAPVQSAPAQSTPVQSVAQSAPVQSVAQSAPVQSVAQSAPVQSVAQSTPVQSVAQSTPVQSVAQSAPVQSAAQSAPVQSAPTQSAFAESFPALTTEAPKASAPKVPVTYAAANSRTTAAKTPPKTAPAQATMAPSTGQTTARTTAPTKARSAGAKSRSPTPKSSPTTSAPTSATSSRTSTPTPTASAPAPTPTAPAPAPAPAQKPSWAALVKGAPSQGGPVINGYSTPAAAADDEEIVTVAVAEDRFAKNLGAFVSTYQLQYQTQALMPRGLINRTAFCYAHSVLQSFLNIPMFCHFLRNLPARPKPRPTSTPICDALVNFASQFNLMPKFEKKALNGKGTVKHLPVGESFEPQKIYALLQMAKYNGDYQPGTHQDAEEFASLILNGMNDELSATVAPKQVEEARPVTPEGDSEEDDGWEQVGPKNKSMVTRQAGAVENAAPTPVSAIFQGQLRSTLSQAGEKESATLEPFFSLKLDIQHPAVSSVTDALQQLVSRENLDGFKCSSTKRNVEAWRKSTIEVLPPVLLLHLKCFVYDERSGDCKKLQKQIHYSVDLEISKDLLSPTGRQKYSHPNSRKYKLCAVVAHHGPRVAGGHYTTYAFHGAMGGWIHMDDGNVTPVSLQAMMRPAPPKVPYLLFYRKVSADKH